LSFAWSSPRAVLATLALAVVGCQALLGDFEIADPPAPETKLGSLCSPNAFRCNGPDLEACGADRQSWDVLKTCASADECDASAAACHPCRPGDYGCDGFGNLQRCSNSLTWRTEATCETASSCLVKDNRTSGVCASPVCEKGAFSCKGNRLLTCAPERDYFELVAPCASAPLCDADAAALQFSSHTPPTCLTPECLPGTFACDGGTLERCNADRNGWDVLTDCGDPAACNPLDGTCTPVGEGTTTCRGAALVKNGPEGFVAVATCASPALCDPVAGTCHKRACGTLGARRCVNDDLPALEECADDGRWLVREVCATGALCSEEEGRCLKPACEPGAERCVGAIHQRCAGDLTRWETVETCDEENGETCGPAGCESNTCTSNRVRCVEASLELCTGGKWDARQRCLTGALCLNQSGTGTGSCGEPKCGGALDDYHCDGPHSIQQCPPGRDIWTDFRPCNTPPELVCNVDPVLGKGIPACAVCVPLAYSCDGTTLRRCAADGQSNPAIATCDGGCSVLAGEPSCLP
jgi:hypothetical protein